MLKFIAWLPFQVGSYKAELQSGRILAPATLAPRCSTEVQKNVQAPSKPAFSHRTVQLAHDTMEHDTIDLISPRAHAPKRRRLAPFGASVVDLTVDTDTNLGRLGC
jgi:hypothetical protein